MKHPSELAEDSLPFIHAAAGAGIIFIKTRPNDPCTIHLLHRVLLDIQREVAVGHTPVAKSQVDREFAEKIAKGDGALIPCDLCYELYHNNPPEYAACLQTCTP